jgi:hypothetical protein
MPIYQDTASVTGQSVDYARGTISGTLSATSNTPVTLDAFTQSSGNITKSGNQITLQAGKTYELQAAIFANDFTAAGFNAIQFYNITAGTFFGSGSFNVAPTWTGNTGTQSTAQAVIAPLVTTVIEIRTSVGSATSAPITLGYSWYMIKQLGSSATTTTTRVNVIARNKTAQSLAVSAWTSLTNWTEIQDPTNSFDPVTGIFTAPRTASYQFSTANGILIPAAGNVFGQCLLLNGVTQLYSTLITAGAANSHSSQTNGVIEMTAGQTLQAQTYNGGATGNDITSATRSWFTITEISNTF